MADPITLYRMRKRRRSLRDPARGLFRTHVFVEGDSFSRINFAADDALEPVTFAIDFEITGDAPNGVLFEIARGDSGVALWADELTGLLGFCAGADELDDNEGVQITTALDHLIASAVDSVAVGGAGYAEDDTITLTGGTFARATVLVVTGETGGVIDTVAIQDAGSYSLAPTDPVAQGSSSGSGTGATFNMTYATVGGKYRVVAACVPGDGTIRLWLNGTLVGRAQTADQSSMTDGWLVLGPGSQGQVNGVNNVVNTRVPVGSRVVLADLTLISGLSAYNKQRPRQYYTGRLG